MGLISYIVEGFDPEGRDVIFIPVGLAYDRVLEDRVLVEAAQSETRRFRNRPLWVAKHATRFLWARFWRRSKGFGTAAAGFGAPVSLGAHLAAGGTVDDLGRRLMAAIAAVVPVLPVPLVARALGAGASSRAELLQRIEALMARLAAAGAILRLAPEGTEAILAEGLEPLIRRGLVGPDLMPMPAGRALLDFYAAAIPEV
jgi:glycerol-3-phosphate O-acyltransferase